MKYLFFLVLLSNAVFFIWEMNTQPMPLNKPSEIVSSNQKPEILLLSELVQNDNEEQFTVMKEQFCYKIGPFSKQQVAQQWFDEHAEQAELLGINSELVKAQIEYQMFIPAGDSEQVTQNNAEKLIGQGILNYSIAKNGEISLAWFVDLNLAKTAQQHLQRLGWGAQIRTREQLKPVFSVNIAIDQTQQEEFSNIQHWQLSAPQITIKLLPEC